jgi:mannose-6-phosphate isomerase-like protein (cupin superfamily)
MGKVVQFSKLPSQHAQGGASIAAITTSDMRELAAAFVSIKPGLHWTATVPDGSDCYLFILEGAGTVSCGKKSCQVLAGGFAAIQEGMTYVIKNDTPHVASLVRVLASPQPKGEMPGFSGGLAVIDRSKAMAISIPAEKTKRVYFVGPYATRSQRGHAMIEIYERDTVNALHHHPNAASMSVILDGALDCTVNGQPLVIGSGQALVLEPNDRHSLRVAAGFAGVSFLEFHTPAAYSTVHDQ